MTRFEKNLLLLIDMAENIKVDNNSNDNYEMSKKLPLYKKSTVGAMGYLTSNAKTAFSQLRKAFNIAPIFYNYDSKYYI